MVKLLMVLGLRCVPVYVIGLDLDIIETCHQKLLLLDHMLSMVKLIYSTDMVICKPVLQNTLMLLQWLEKPEHLFITIAEKMELLPCTQALMAITSTLMVLVLRKPKSLNLTVISIMLVQATS